MKNERTKVVTIKMTRYVNFLVKGSDEQLDQDYAFFELNEDYSNEAIKEEIGFKVGESNVYVEDYWPEYDFAVVCEKYIDKEWLNGDGDYKDPQYFDEQHRKIVAKDSGWFDDVQTEAA